MSVVAEVEVVAVERLSPAFVRIVFAAPELAEMGTGGPIYDQRIKLIFPRADGRLPVLDGGDWWETWSALPEEERGWMRTYSIRDLSGSGPDRRLVVDFVLHLEPGLTGPAGLWASTAAPGQRVIVVGPREGEEWGGIEFEPGKARRILLAGDETAVPAIARILADLGPSFQGTAYLEVPEAEDALPLTAPVGIEIRWLPRNRAVVGERLLPAVVGHFGARAGELVAEAEDNVWETPTFSGTGEELETGGGAAELYAWIAGESAVVTTIRRHLVREVGLDRRQVAFMGYWRRGVAMRG